MVKEGVGEEIEEDKCLLNIIDKMLHKIDKILEMMKLIIEMIIIVTEITIINKIDLVNN